MNKHILTLATALTLLFIGGGCDYNDDNFEGLQHGTVATDVKRFDYTLTDDDYKTIATNAANKTLASANSVSSELASVATNKYFTKKVTGTDYIPNFLAATYPTADNGSAIKVTYNFFNQAVTCFNEDFKTVTNNGPVPDTWTNIVTNDDETSAQWVSKIFSNNGFVQCSAFQKGPTEVYLVSPVIEVEADMTFSFKACYGNYKSEGGTLTVLISSDLEGEVTKESIAAATWKDITDQVNITIPTGQYGTLEEVCAYKMDDFAGKEVRIAFRYDGDGTTGANKTTTVQIDDIKIADTETEEGTVAKAEQFVRSKGHWSFDPSVVLVLPAGKDQQLSAKFFQACVDWVFENIDTPLGSTGIKSGAYYVTSYGNNEYYTGASAHQGNLDWRISAARGQYAAAFEGKTDAEVTELLQARTGEVFAAVLPQFYPELEPLEGIDVTATIQCTVYTGSSTVYNFVFKVVEKSKFEFVSFAPVE